ncbi:MAG: hypothetical protein AAFU85_03430, partial [Planctomycetota bacterium]
PTLTPSRDVLAVTVPTRLIGGLIVVALAGCSSSETPIAPNAAVGKAHVEQAPVVEAAPVSLSAKENDSETEFDSLQKLLAEFSSGNDGSFFGQPEKPKPKQSVAEVVRPQVTIRLIGLLSGKNTMERALLKFDDTLVYLSPGQRHDDIELVSIDRRTVKLRGKDGNWTVSLLDQPGLTDVAAANAFERRNRDSTPASGLELPDANNGESREFFTPPSLPLQDGLLAPQESALGQPQDGDMEEMFDLPDLPDFAF